MNRYILQKFLPHTTFLVVIVSIAPFSRIPLGNTIILLFFETLVLYSFYYVSRYFIRAENNKKYILLLKSYLVYNVISFIYGIFQSESYWDYKNLFSFTYSLLIPVVSFAGMNVNFLLKLFRFYIKYTLPLLLFFIFFISGIAVGFYLIPFSLFALFIPKLKVKWKIVVLSFSVFVIVYEIGARSNIIKFFIPLFFSTLYYFRKIISVNLLEIIRNLMFAIPFVLFFLGVTNTFNIFKMDEYMGDISQNSNLSEEDKAGLTADTRTLIYEEVLISAKKHNSWIFGRSPARGNETELFGALSDVTGRNERGANEVAILNIFTWTGLIGVLFYFIIFYLTSFYAINCSNNFFSKILGVYMAFRWCYAWVEDINIFSMTSFSLWLVIGLSLSSEFRSMKNHEVSLWVNGIFGSTDYKKYKLYTKIKNEN